MENDQTHLDLAKLQARDIDVFRQLVETYKHRVLNTCYRFVHDAQDAEDIAQEVFIEVYDSLPKFRSEALLSTWVYRIAVNKSLDFVRKKARRRKIAQFFSLENSQEQAEQSQNDRRDNPDRMLEQQQHTEILHQALNQLPENQRAAITLNKLEGFNSEEIAAIMQTSRSSAESLIHRAKQNLRSILTKHYQKKE